MARIDKPPVAFERWVFRWIFVPFCVSGVVVALATAWHAKRECRMSCLEKGFSNFKYVSPPWRGEPSRCDCATPAPSPKN